MSEKYSVTATLAVIIGNDSDFTHETVKHVKVCFICTGTTSLACRLEQRSPSAALARRAAGGPGRGGRGGAIQLQATWVWRAPRRRCFKFLRDGPPPRPRVRKRGREGWVTCAKQRGPVTGPLHQGDAAASAAGEADCGAATPGAHAAD